MKIYAISGLGADKRVFNFLKLNHTIIALDWIEPNKEESLESYSNRLLAEIDKKSDFVLIGVSFGGLVAVEISKIIEPQLTFLISSAETRSELNPIYRLIGRLKILEKIPSKFFDPPRQLVHFLFGTSNKGLLNKILDDSDLSFVKWAVTKLTQWSNEEKLSNVIRIHGTADKLIPWKNCREVYMIEGGQHFMIVDKAEEISNIINEEIKTHPNINN